MAYVLSERPVLYCKLRSKNTTVVSNRLPKKNDRAMSCHHNCFKGRYGFSVGAFLTLLPKDSLC